MNPLPNYPGSKGGSGVAKRLVSLMPHHRVYVEAFLGGGSVMRLKRPALRSIAIDQDPGVIRVWRESIWGGVGVSVAIVEGDFIEWLQRARGREPLGAETLIYCDPPYLMETRTRLFYEHEFHDPLRHALLLSLVQDLKCMVMISGYPSKLYEDTLKDWRCVRYRTMTHGGAREECCWLNFPEPQTFHDPRWQGDGFRERERIKRKAQRWEARFGAMAASERAVIAAALAMVDRATVEQSLRGQ